MKNAVLVHGKGGAPNESWLPWLKGQLEQKGYSCQAPEFPSEDDSKLADWFTVFAKSNIDLQNTTFIAHARGAMALLRWVNQLPKDIKIPKVITIACNFDFQPDRTDGDEFYASELNYEDLKNKCGEIIVIHSADDPYVSIEAGRQLAKNLNARFVAYKNAGHFGSDKIEAPEILKEIRCSK